MPWRSCYYEIGAEPEKYLRESGFRRFPVLAPRWATAGGDIYGHSPAMECLGDIKQLQHEQLRKAQGIDYKTKPPLQAPTNLRNRDVDRLPGGITFVDSANPQGGIRTAFETNIDLSHLLEDIVDVRQRIRTSFFADLFLMLANAADTRMTATEVAERHEEKLLMLGPVLERLHHELLDPLIDLTFDRMMEVGMLPPPPPELAGLDLSIEFVSMLAQAQRAIGVNGVDRFLGNLSVVAQMKPETLDKLNADELVDGYAEMLGISERPSCSVAGCSQCSDGREGASGDGAAAGSDGEQHGEHADFGPERADGCDEHVQRLQRAAAVIHAQVTRQQEGAASGATSAS